MYAERVKNVYKIVIGEECMNRNVETHLALKYSSTYII